MASFNPLQVRYKRQKSAPGSFQARCFNPLQVRYKQNKVGHVCSSHSGFNPLQVRYKRGYATLNGKPKEEFQSLIGTLQTSGKICIAELSEKVSIPYRYATNSFLSHLGYHPEHGFNPLQVRYKRLLVSCQGFGKACFNPLQVRYKQQVLVGFLHKINRFNPLQVRYKLQTGNARERAFPSFNPLQVRYKLSCG